MGGGRAPGSLALLWALTAVLQVAGSSRCDSVFRGFSDCLIQLGDSMADYPPDLDDRQNLHRICTYWDNFHSCATTALADCQEGAAELWDKLKKESRSLNFRGSLFELCGAGSGAPRAAGAGGGLLGPVPLPLLVPVLVLVLSALPAALRWLEL